MTNLHYVTAFIPEPDLVSFHPSLSYKNPSVVPIGG